MEKGFQAAFLRNIIKTAGVTTGAFYVYYNRKEELFSAVVADTVRDLEEIIEQTCLTDRAGISDEALVRAWEMDGEYMVWWFRYLYERYDGFGLNGSGDTGVCGAHSGKAEEADRGRICRACVSAC